MARRKQKITDHDLIHVVLRDRIDAQEKLLESKKEEMEKLDEHFQKLLQAAFKKKPQGKAMLRAYPNIRATSYHYRHWRGKKHLIGYELYTNDGKRARYSDGEELSGEIKITAREARTISKVQDKIEDLRGEIRRMESVSNRPLIWRRESLRNLLQGEPLKKIRAIVEKATKDAANRRPAELDLGLTKLGFRTRKR